jgi:ATP-dependent Clp protease adaptor protein ClpS
MAGRQEDRQGGVLEKSRDQAEHPEMFRVLLHNDDYTPMDFVLEVLETIFGKSPAESYRVMMLVHQGGVGEAGIFTFEIAETKVSELQRRARDEGHPLRASIEPID